MAAADVVDSQLRNTVRSARARSLRCVKAILTKRALPMDSSETSHSSYTLAFANSAPDEGQSLDKEFQRCIRSLLEPDRPSFLLFRADLNENIDGGRWLLLAWLPDVVPEVDRVRYVRSRGLLVDLVPQPYFLCELLLRQTSQLVWSTAAAALRPRPIDSDRPESTVDGAYPRSTVTMEGPVRISQAAQGLLRRLASREECCCCESHNTFSIQNSILSCKTQLVRLVNIWAGRGQIWNKSSLICSPLIQLRFEVGLLWASLIEASRHYAHHCRAIGHPLNAQCSCDRSQGHRMQESCSACKDRAACYLLLLCFVHTG